MSIRPFDQCDDCGRRMKTTHSYQAKRLCGVCYKKKFNIISGPQIFTEPVNNTISLTVGLTASQKKIFDERVKYLFPNLNNCRRKYLRGLILGDIENWKRKAKSKKKGD